MNFGNGFKMDARGNEVPHKKIKLSKSLKNDRDSDSLCEFGLDVASKLRNMNEKDRKEAINLIRGILTKKQLVSNSNLSINNENDDSLCSKIAADSKIYNESSNDSCNDLNENLLMKIEIQHLDHDDEVQYISETNPLEINSVMPISNVGNDDSLFINSIENMCNITDAIKSRNNCDLNDGTSILTNNSTGINNKYLSLINSQGSEHVHVSDTILNYKFISTELENKHNLLEPKIEISSQFESVFENTVNDTIYDMNQQLCSYPNADIGHSEIDAYSLDHYEKLESASDAESDVSYSSSVSIGLDSDVEDICLALLLLRHFRNKRKKRKYWVAPENRERLTGQHLGTVFSNLKTDPNEFYSYFQISVYTFDKLLSCIGKYIQKNNTNMRMAISAEERLAVTLRYFATGNTLKSIGREFRIGISTISHIVKDVMQIIWTVLKRSYMAKPTEQKWLEIADGFKMKTGFPNCLGALNVKCVKVTGNKRNQPGKYFLFCFVVDSSYNFTHVEIIDYEECDDRNLLNSLTLGKWLTSGQLNLPDETTLSDSANDDVTLPYVFVADKSFALHANIMKAFYTRKGQSLTDVQSLFNYRFDKAFGTADSTLAIMYNRWALFRSSILMKTPNATKIIKAACVLHNFICIHDGYTLDSSGLSCDMTNLNRITGRGTVAGCSVRNRFVNYFAARTSVIDTDHITADNNGRVGRNENRNIDSNNDN